MLVYQTDPVNSCIHELKTIVSFNRNYLQAPARICPLTVLFLLPFSPDNQFYRMEEHLKTIKPKMYSVDYLYFKKSLEEE